MEHNTKTTVEEFYDKKLENLNQVLLKKAMGYKMKETIDEFGLVDDQLKLVKKKVTVKYYPPDLEALELLLKTQTENNLTNLTDEELEQEKQRLLKKLKINTPQDWEEKEEE